MFKLRLIVIAVIVTIVLGALVWPFFQDKGYDLEAKLPLTDALNTDDTEGFARAMQARPLSFPEDHGPHQKYRIEWWYFTGNLKSDANNHYGYQLTFFRLGLRAQPAHRTTNWGTNTLYMAHFAVTDVKEKKFHYFERFSRETIGLAGSTSRPFRVWLEDWYVHGQGEDGTPMRLHAKTDGFHLDLECSSAKPIILHGDRGFSRKGSEPGNASYYYSLTRLQTQGSLKIDGKTFQVSGTSWMDREWSTSALEKEQQGWDWFSLQLSDNREIMFFQLRRKDGSIDPHSSGTMITPTGESRPLSLADVKIEVLDHWPSPLDGSLYPSSWRLTIPGEDMELEIAPFLNNQELDTAAIRYWEGAVRVNGRSGDASVNGVGYAELTGYGGDQPVNLN
ncbi:lipocalin-like domain-containing protein [Desulfogranum marinum]|uniref:lipocalin-like domain-containing protein n=1 Tax=Desulfogranum marinum TaxID=453220 RepID=UPI001964ED5A|nr:lipocalin-like domain-containing protein [Desulfogranum marinum]MBM9514666.1 carotenoid 1,2-hydratase [Desulfogranum marinum]